MRGRRKSDGDLQENALETLAALRDALGGLSAAVEAHQVATDALLSAIEERQRAAPE